MTGTDDQGATERPRSRLPALELLQVGLMIAILVGASAGAALIQPGLPYRAIGAGFLGLAIASLVLLLLITEPWRRDES